MRGPLCPQIRTYPPHSLPLSGDSVLPGWKYVTGQPSREVTQLPTDLLALAPARQDHESREAPTLKRSWMLACRLGF